MAKEYLPGFAISMVPIHLAAKFKCGRRSLTAFQSASVAKLIVSEMPVTLGCRVATSTTGPLAAMGITGDMYWPMK